MSPSSTRIPRILTSSGGRGPAKLYGSSPFSPCRGSMTPGRQKLAGGDGRLQALRNRAGNAAHTS